MFMGVLDQTLFIFIEMLTAFEVLVWDDMMHWKSQKHFLMGKLTGRS